MKKAVFLDRDGTINFDSDHVFDPEKLFLLPGAADAISLARSSGYLIVLVTNQSCIGRGYATYHQVNATHQKLRQLLLSESPRTLIDLILVAPDHPDSASQRRKPSPGMLLEAAENLNLDLNQCWIIGDKPSDPQAGEAAGIPKDQCLLLHPNQVSPPKDSPKNTNYKIFPNILEAVSYLTGNDPVKKK